MILIHGNSRVKSWRNKKDPQRIKKNKTFINKYNWEEINFPPQKDDLKKLEKIIKQLFLKFYMLMLKNKKYILLMFQNKTQIS